jgi:hypothetical protein
VQPAWGGRACTYWAPSRSSGSQIAPRSPRTCMRTADLNQRIHVHTQSKSAAVLHLRVCTPRRTGCLGRRRHKVQGPHRPHLIHHTDGPARLLRHHGGLTSTIWGSMDGWTRAGCTHDGVLCVWPYRHGCSQLIVRQSRAARCLVESLATDGAVPWTRTCGARLPGRAWHVCVSPPFSPQPCGAAASATEVGCASPPPRAVSIGRSIV